MSTTYVSLKSLIVLQGELKNLSEELNETYDLLMQNEKVGEQWQVLLQDSKFDDFEEEFSKKRELISELSKKYKDWADNYLPPYLQVRIIYNNGLTGEFEESLEDLSKYKGWDDLPPYLKTIILGTQ